MQLKFALVAAALAALILPAAASASTVSVEGGVLVLRAAPGERNVVGVAPDETDALVQIDDVDRPAYPADVCEPPFWDPTAVACTPQPGGVRIELDDGEDSATVYGGTPGSGPMVLLGGEGADDLHARTYQAPLLLDGGSGDDELTGGMAGDTLAGGPGDDDLSGLRGGDHLLGGEGADKLLGDDHDAPGADTIDGGPGSDRIDHDWAAALDKPQPPIEVSLDGVANDGRPGEGDNVVAVETIHLGNPATLIAGGDPVDFEVFNTAAVPSRLTGSPGADRLRSYDGADAILAGGGDDWVEAGYGDDTIGGGPGRDTINADAGSGACNFLVCRLPLGNDTIDVRDGVADSVECGPGNDTVSADRIDRLTNCEAVTLAGPAGPGGRRGCVVPKLKRGSKLAPGRAALRRAGCSLKVVRVKSKLKRGRVLGTSPAAGKSPKRGAKVMVRVSRGPRKTAGAGASSIDVVSPPARVVDPIKLRCVKLSYGGRACGKRFGDAWSKGWWTNPAEFEIVDVRLHGDTEMTVPSDEYKSFKGDGYTIVKATPGVRGKFTLPSRTAAVPVSSMIARPVKWKMESRGAWTTTDGVYGCGVREQPGSPATSLAGVVSADRRKGTIKVQWSIVPAGFRCPDEGAISNPEFEGLPSEAMTTEYRAAGFRGAELLKLPVSIEWEGVQSSDNALLLQDWGGSVVLRRVHHRIGRASTSRVAAEPATESAEVLRIAPGGVTGRFVAPPTVVAGEDLEVVNETDPKKVGPHTLTLVERGALPRTAKARKSCFAPGRICDAIARWHKLDFKTGKVGRDLVDVGARGWSTMGSTAKTGDSWFTDELGESVVQPVSAKPREIHFICLIHPWMQGRTRVLPAS